MALKMHLLRSPWKLKNEVLAAVCVLGDGIERLTVNAVLSGESSKT